MGFPVNPVPIASGAPRCFRATACVALLSLVTACGACGDVKRIDLKTVPTAQLAADKALFGNALSFYPGLNTEFNLDKLAKHPEAAQVFISLGYARRQGRRLDYTRRGLATSQDLKYGLRSFQLENPRRAGPARFTYETEEVLCNEGHESWRTYGYDYYVGSLTPLGRALLARGLLYRGSGSEKPSESPVRWKGPAEPLHSTFALDPSGASRELSRTWGGESIDFLWGRTFAGD